MDRNQEIVIKTEVLASNEVSNNEEARQGDLNARDPLSLENVKVEPKEEPAPRTDRIRCVQPGCMEHFLDYGTMEEHWNMVHGRRNMKSVKVEPKEEEVTISPDVIRCVQPGCIERFPDFDTMEKHWDEVHLRKPHFRRTQVWKCAKFCDSTFTNTNEHTRHRRRCGNVKEKCKYCDEDVMRKNMKDHQASHHSSDLKFSCADCGFKAENQSSVNRHVNLYHRGKTNKSEGTFVKCKDCIEMVVRKNMKNHQVKHHSKDLKFSCSQCGYMGKNQPFIDRHMDRYHPQKPPELKCSNFSDSTLDKDQQLFQHEIVCGDTRVRCNDCIELVLRKNMKDHRAQHHSSDLKFACRSCGYRADNQPCVERHFTRYHVLPKPCDLKCSKFCDTTFYNQQQLNNHHKVCGEMYVKCKDCVELVLGKDMKKHKKVHHSSDSQLKCKTCEFRAKDQQSIDEHVKRFHKGKDLVRCVQPKCSKLFPDYDTMEAHWHAIHSKVLQGYKCSRFCDSTHHSQLEYFQHMRQCGETYERCKNCVELVMRKNMKNHQSEHHSNDLQFSCTSCGYRDADQISVDKHLKRYHLKVKVKKKTVSKESQKPANQPKAFEENKKKPLGIRMFQYKYVQKEREGSKDVVVKQEPTDSLEDQSQEPVDQMGPSINNNEKRKTDHQSEEPKLKVIKQEPVDPLEKDQDGHITDQLESPLVKQASDHQSEKPKSKANEQLNPLDEKSEEPMESSTDKMEEDTTEEDSDTDDTDDEETEDEELSEEAFDLAKCEECEESTLVKDMEKHRVDHHSDDLNFTCFCGYRAVDQGTVNRHVEAYHPDTYHLYSEKGIEESPGLIRCDKCVESLSMDDVEKCLEFRCTPGGSTCTLRRGLQQRIKIDYQVMLVFETLETNEKNKIQTPLDLGNGKLSCLVIYIMGIELVLIHYGLMKKLCIGRSREGSNLFN